MAISSETSKINNALNFTPSDEKNVLENRISFQGRMRRCTLSQKSLQCINHKTSFADRITKEIALMAFFNISINGKDPALNEI